MDNDTVNYYPFSFRTELEKLEEIHQFYKFRNDEVFRFVAIFLSIFSTPPGPPPISATKEVGEGPLCPPPRASVPSPKRLLLGRLPPLHPL